VSHVGHSFRCNEGLRAPIVEEEEGGGKILRHAAGRRYLTAAGFALLTAVETGMACIASLGWPSSGNLPCAKFQIRPPLNGRTRDEQVTNGNALRRTWPLMTNSDKKNLLKWNTLLWLAAMVLPAVFSIAFASNKFPWPMIFPLLLLGPMLGSNKMLTRAIGESTDKL
jgi:hypothetical protein